MTYLVALPLATVLASALRGGHTLDRLAPPAAITQVHHTVGFTLHALG